MSSKSTAMSDLNPVDDCKISLPKMREVATKHLQNHIKRYAEQRGGLESLEASLSEDEIVKVRTIQTTGLPVGEGRFARKLGSRLGIAIHEKVPLHRIKPERRNEWRQLMQDRGAFSVGLCGLEVGSRDESDANGETTLPGQSTGGVDLPDYPVEMFIQRRIIELL